ncbi:MAG TPA: response regulator [Alphaproteobacteria bacterium]|nr:response regulator [Alphaproteobacteria bacterium]
MKFREPGRTLTPLTGNVMQLDLSQLLVMIIDDNRFIRRLVHEILRGFNVGFIVEAENGADAMEKFKVAKPDIVFCDWLMQPTTGLELLREVRAGRTALSSNTPVIMMTGQLDVDSVLAARDLGVSGYLAKPVTVDGVMTRIVDVVGASAMA